MAMHSEAVRDADLLISVERELEKKNPQLKLCEGFKVRANAFYAAGEFEKALLDYCSCYDRRNAPEYQLGIDNCRESIRRAFDYSMS